MNKLIIAALSAAFILGAAGEASAKGNAGMGKSNYAHTCYIKDDRNICVNYITAMGVKKSDTVRKALKALKAHQ